MQLADLLKETLDVDSLEAWENERTPRPVRVFGGAPALDGSLSEGNDRRPRVARRQSLTWRDLVVDASAGGCFWVSDCPLSIGVERSARLFEEKSDRKVVSDARDAYRPLPYLLAGQSAKRETLAQSLRSPL